MRDKIIGLTIGLSALAGCGEAASTWDDKSGHFISTKEYRERQIERAINKHDRENECARKRWEHGECN
jgi:hypothetical protein